MIGFCAGGMTQAAVLSHLAATDDDLVERGRPGGHDDRHRGDQHAQHVRQRADGADRHQPVPDARACSTGASLARCSPGSGRTTWSGTTGCPTTCSARTRPPSTCWRGTTTPPTCRPTLHAEFMHMWLDNALIKPGTVSVLGTPVDLSQVKNDVYVVGALTDHLVPWQSAYAATQAFGGRRPLRPVQQRPHPGPGQPARQPQGQLFRRSRRTQADPDRWLKSAHPRRTAAGGWTGPTGRSSAPANADPGAAYARQPTSP